MPYPHHHKPLSAVFITFSGNCKKALSHYQTCFGGQLQLETFGNGLRGFTGLPVISGSLVSERIIIYGSDLVHNEGRKTGNYISIYLHCNSNNDRTALFKKLAANKDKLSITNNVDVKLVEFTDTFDVRWVLGV